MLGLGQDKQAFNPFDIHLIEHCIHMYGAIHYSIFLPPVDSHVPLDLADLMNEVAAVIPSKWRAVGIQLRLSPGTLDSIQSHKPQACQDSFREVFTNWMSGGDSQYTWPTIIDALKTPAVGEVELAQKS